MDRSDLHLPIASLLAPAGWERLRQALFDAGRPSRLQFTLSLVVILGLLSIYLWQLSTITAIETSRQSMLFEIERLDRVNSQLLLSLAEDDGSVYLQGQPGQ